MVQVEALGILSVESVAVVVALKAGFMVTKCSIGWHEVLAEVYRRQQNKRE